MWSLVHLILLGILLISSSSKIFSHHFLVEDFKSNIDQAVLSSRLELSNLKFPFESSRAFEHARFKDKSAEGKFNNNDDEHLAQRLVKSLIQDCIKRWVGENDFASLKRLGDCMKIKDKMAIEKFELRFNWVFTHESWFNHRCMNERILLRYSQGVLLSLSVLTSDCSSLI